VDVVTGGLAGTLIFAHGTLMDGAVVDFVLMSGDSRSLIWMLTAVLDAAMGSFSGLALCCRI